MSMIRQTKESDLPVLLSIFEYARQEMKKNGNPTQWGDNRPVYESIVKDIQREINFVIEEDGQIIGTFSFMKEEDPFYREIDGKWLNDKPYGVIHKVASSGKRKGIMQDILAFCEKQATDIRIDTHKDNAIMQHILEENGYIKCGIIYVDDGTPRLAYQKEVSVI